MSEEIQRVIGELLARVQMLEKELTRVQGAFILIGASAVGLVVVLLLKQAGLM